MTAAASAELHGPRREAARFKAQRYVLPICAACSLALHASLFAVRVSPLPSQAARAAADGPRILQVRLQPSPITRSSDTPVVQQRPPTEPWSAPAVAVAPAARPTHRAEPAVAETPAPAVPVLPAAEPETALPVSIASSAVAAAEHDDYVPRPLLSRPPVATTPVILLAPAGETAIARYVGILSLFIDEQGRVQHVIADEPALPAAFEQAAREAFMAARFAPGQVDGRAVKSRQRVEVVFDNTPLAR